MSRQGSQESFLAFHRLCLRLGAVTLGIEIKVWRDRRADPLVAGLMQLERYLARLGLESGWLVIFDRRSTALPIEARLGTEEVQTEQRRRVMVIRGDGKDGGRRRCGQTVVNRVIVDLGCHTMKDFGILVRFGPSQGKDLLKLCLSASQRLAFYVERMKF